MKDRMLDFIRTYWFETKMTGANGIVMAFITMGNVQAMVAIGVGITAIICNIVITRKKRILLDQQIKQLKKNETPPPDID
jgi:hypothetical protein